MTDFSDMFEKIFNEKELLKENINLNKKEKNFILPEELINIISNLQKIFQTMTETEQNIEIIKAIKPLLNEETQKKSDDAIKLIKIFSIIPILKEKGILN